MNTLLLDTHALIWFVQDDPRLPDITGKLIEDSEVLVSEASLWEIAIKVSLGKLKLKDTLSGFLNTLNQFSFTRLTISDAVLQRLADLPWHHRDPFDRLLIAQAQVLNIPIVTKDGKFETYDVQLIWKKG